MACCSVLITACVLVGMLGSMSALPSPPEGRKLPSNPEFSKPDPAVGDRVSEWEKQEEKVGYPEELGTYYQGDIMVPKEPSVSLYNGIYNRYYRWPNAVVPYTFSSTVSSNARSTVEQAMRDISARTCVRFVQRTTQTDYVNIQRANSGCWSYVGKIGGRQALNLQDPGCVYVGTAIHELMHALGFFHEHEREDRDRYISIQWGNVQSGMESAFEISRGDNYGTPYDYGSVMHYSSHAFSSNGRATIVPRQSGVTLGSRSLSNWDAQLINTMYSCYGKK